MILPELAKVFICFPDPSRGHFVGFADIWSIARKHYLSDCDRAD